MPATIPGALNRLTHLSLITTLRGTILCVFYVYFVGEETEGADLRNNSSKIIWPMGGGTEMQTQNELQNPCAPPVILPPQQWLLCTVNTVPEGLEAFPVSKSRLPIVWKRK